MSITCAIHQPNFLPWLGYFYKIQTADVFIFLDSVPMSTGGASAITHRTRIRLGEKEHFLSLPMQKTGAKRIQDERIVPGNHLQKLKKTVAQSYAKAPYFKQTWPLLDSVLSYPSLSLSDFNIHGIESVCSALGWSPRLLRSSDLVQSWSHIPQKSELLIALCQRVGADRYLAGGGGSRNYLDIDLFRAAGIEVVYSPFAHPIYRQFGNTFIPGLSAMDALFHVGSLPSQ
jgi:hypothetical protein